MILRDLHQALRQLARTPGLTAAAVASLAIGVAAVATTFTWADQMLWRPLPGVRPADGLITITSRNAMGMVGSLSHPDYVDTRDGVADVAGVAATALTPVTLTAPDGGPAERVFAELVSDNYFETLGAAVVLGRPFTPEESAAGRPVAILNDALWRTRFSAAPGILGQPVYLNGDAVTVVGIAAASFHGGYVAVQTDLWVPLVRQPSMTAGDLLTARSRRWLFGLARLRPGAGFDDLSARLDTVSRRLAADHAATNSGRTLAAHPIWRSPVGAQALLRPVLVPLGALALFVFLLGCANVANMLLATTLRRRRAFAIRLALGASRAQLVRHFAVESLLMAVLAGAVGLAVTIWAVDLLRVFQPPTAFRGDFDVDVNWAVAAAALAFALAAASVVGLVPVLDTIRSDTTSVLREESQFIVGRRRRGVAASLTALQVSFSVAVLVGCGLCLRSVERSRSLDPGFRADGVILASYDLTGTGYTEARGATFHRELLRRVQQAPGVTAASLASTTPFGLEGQSVAPVEVEGYTPGPDEDMQVRVALVGPAYFRTMAIPLLSGRDVGWEDDEGASLAAVVSRRFAAQYFPGADPQGRSVRFRGRTFAVVGVAGDVRYSAVEAERMPTVYLSVLQNYRSAMTLHVRTVEAAVLPLRPIVDEVDRSVPLFRIIPFTQQVEAATFVQRFGASLSLLLAVASLILTAAGIHGLLRHSLVERMREIGLRMALGAGSHQVAGLILRHACVITAGGVAAGVAGGMGVARLLAGMLIDVGARDPVTWSVALAAATGVALLAGGSVARRAARITPLDALSSRSSSG